MKIIGNKLLWERLKINIHSEAYIIVSITCYYMHWTHTPTENNNQSLISIIVTKNGLFQSNIVISPQLTCDVMQTWVSQWVI